MDAINANYRATKCCGNCDCEGAKDFGGILADWCKKFNRPVLSSWVCDEWEED